MVRQYLVLLLITCFSTAPLVRAAVPEENYLVGRGIADVTGPVVGLPLWGFGRPDQIGEGLHTRLSSRAFVIAERRNPLRRLVFASVDIGSIDHHIALSVIDSLRARFGDVYGLHNIIISATHTHSGPSGYWQSRTDNGFDGGFYPQHYEAVVEGIVDSIIRAHEDLQPASVLINSGRLVNAGVNRSAVAYQANPAEERARYADNTNTTMTLLKFTSPSGDMGLISWFALHPTAINYYSRLVSGDHKGYASIAYERTLSVDHAGNGEFVAAFAQSDPGDVTPNTNLDNTGPGDSDMETARIMGDRQLQKARSLFESASEMLRGPIDARQVYVNLKGYEVENRFTQQGVQRTCPSAYGYSFAGGSTEDGGGHFLFREGMKEQSAWRDWLIRIVTGTPAFNEEVRTCHAPKPILFDVGSQEPPLQSQVHTVTLARIGQLVILAIPGEVTTMSGRRLRETVMADLGDWAEHIVLAGYANEFAGYITTPEEYDLQQYEAAHNLHGRWSLPAYQQVASQLANDMQSGRYSDSKTVYDDWRGKTTALALPVHPAGGSSGSGSAGQLVTMERQSYRPGDTVRMTFQSVDPNAHFVTGSNFLEVQRKNGLTWEIIATDTDWSTRIRWQFKRGVAAELEWDIPQDAEEGVYRMRHRGFMKKGELFQGESAEIQVAR